MDIVIPSDRGKADNPYPEEWPFGRVSKDEARVPASWFETHTKRALLTSRV